MGGVFCARRSEGPGTKLASTAPLPSPALPPPPLSGHPDICSVCVPPFSASSPCRDEIPGPQASSQALQDVPMCLAPGLPLLHCGSRAGTRKLQLPSCACTCASIAVRHLKGGCKSQGSRETAGEGGSRRGRAEQILLATPAARSSCHVNRRTPLGVCPPTCPTTCQSPFTPGLPRVSPAVSPCIVTNQHNRPGTGNAQRQG